jgi:hypothetical protein
MKKALYIFILSALISVVPARAWIYPEHREITLLAVQKLNPAYREMLTKIWIQARTGHENRLHFFVIDTTLTKKPLQIDFAAWPAIAGDHSISSSDMINNILYTQWILNVAEVTAHLRMELARSASASERAAAMREADLRLLRVDPEYVTRAGSNSVHFMLARPHSKMTLPEYLDTCFRKGSEINLIGVYKWYHASAMLKARQFASDSLSPAERSAMAMAVLADEAFALHFLEDSFSAGHVAGIWGNAALRKGTHDYYDENGLEVTTWQGTRMVIAGDAFMRNCDAEVASETAARSLMQVLDAAFQYDLVVMLNDRNGWSVPDTFNVGRDHIMPERTLDDLIWKRNSAILTEIPIPGLGNGIGEIPRFRSELGPFIGIAPAVRTSIISGGFGATQQTMGIIPGLEFSVHIGLGMEGVLNASGDGLVFLDLGWRLDGSSSIKIDHEPGLKAYGAILSAIPTRNAAFLRFRMPFYLIPGDLLLLGPILMLTSPEKLNTVVATAGQGGLIPWQTGLISPLGRFQFILGREIGVAFYGWFKPDALLVPDHTMGEPTYKFVSIRSTQLEFPVLEYRPVRTFSKRQSASLLLQLYAGLDIPGKSQVIDQPDVPVPPYKIIGLCGVRLAFDWRYYYAKKRVSGKH